MLGILDLLLVVWPQPFASFLVVSSVLHFDLDVLSPNCVVSMPALMSYSMSLFGFVVLLLVLVLIHCVSVLVFFGGRFKERMPSLIGVVGTTFMAVFISISSAIFAPVQCDGHTNGYRTVQKLPTDFMLVR